MAFPQSFLDELIARNDIVDVVSGYVRLGKRSGANIWGLCPFHSEKTPSFSVLPDRQIYHCFGCGKGGGVINFIMDAENLSYPEAVKFLANRVNLPVPDDAGDREAQKKKRMLALNKEAARFFHEQLRLPAGAPARDYMERRGISRTAAVNFGLGYAPDDWHALENAMRDKGYSSYELADAGLVKKGGRNGLYDTFRNRLMFPVIDVSGNVIGFSGRLLEGDGPKYLNSPDTLVFNKGRNLFALNLAKKSKSGYIMLSEGNIDVVSLHQAGFDSAVASLGTSLTDAQARLLSNYTREIIIAYDNDAAGQKATQRAITILEKLDLKVKVLRMSGAKDPDEYIRLKGADAFRRLLEGSENQLDFRMKAIAEKYDLSQDAQKVAFVKEAEEFLARLPGDAERQVYTLRVAAMTGLKADGLLNEVSHKRKLLIKKNEKALLSGSSPTRLLQPAARELHYSDPASAAAEEGVIRLLYLEPALLNETGLPPPEDFSSPALGKLYACLSEHIRSDGQVSSAVLSGELTSEEMSLLVSLLQKPELLSNSRQAMQDYIKKIRERKERSHPADDLLALQKKLQEEKGYTG